MSLLTSYGSNNKVTNRALCVRYSVVLQPETSNYRVTRTAKKSYGYVGMTKTAAETCKNDKVSMYTRLYSQLYSSGSNASPYTVLKCGASIRAYHGDGETWRVDVEVSEIDVKTSSVAPSDPASLFASENLRAYDESPNSHLVVDSAHGTTVAYHVSLIEDIGWCNLLVNDSPVMDVSTSATSATLITPLSSGDEVQLRYGPLVSNIVEVD